MNKTSHKIKNKYNHLFHLDNTQENRDLIKFFNKNMKEHNSKWRFNIKYRKPKDGKKYGWGGTLKQENAKKFAVYLNGGHTKEEMHLAWERSWNANNKVRKAKEELEIVEDYVDSCYNQIQQVKEMLER